MNDMNGGGSPTQLVAYVCLHTCCFMEASEVLFGAAVVAQHTFGSPIERVLSRCAPGSLRVTKCRIRSAELGLRGTTTILLVKQLVGDFFLAVALLMELKLLTKSGDRSVVGKFGCWNLTERRFGPLLDQNCGTKVPYLVFLRAEFLQTLWCKMVHPSDKAVESDTQVRDLFLFMNLSSDNISSSDLAPSCRASESYSDRMTSNSWR